MLRMQHGHLEHLREVGVGVVDTLSDSEELPAMPHDFDVDKFNRGRKFFLNNIFSCTLSMLSSLIAGLSVVNLLEPLVFTRESNTPLKSLLRYVRTFHHVVIWHYGNVWDPSSGAHKSVAKVRRLHNSVRRRMTGGETVENPPVSQYDMSLVQCGFMGGIVMYPEGFGIRCSSADLSDYCYFWYGIGFLLGISDKNNICKRDLVETVAICKEIESDILLPALHDPPRDFYPMAQALVDGMNFPLKYFCLFSLESFLYVSYATMSAPRPKLGLADRLRALFLQSFFILVKYVPFCRSLLNRLVFLGLNKKFLEGEILDLRFQSRK
ncbi:uncharacterized protein [Littorina saxatilis]|uniref:uncharacterized protein n=1 Tax=Littorina saxatilis TaxID=31220 RepID=UPI0038B46C46